MKTAILKILLIMLACSSNHLANANSISISNVSTTGQDVSAGTNNSANYILVQFDISWNNSFRDATNWDAAWVFIKYQVSGTTTWSHATLSTGGHTAPSGSTITTPSDGMGIFIYRDAIGTGNNAFSSVKLRWNYGVDGVLDNDALSLKVMGIEMIYVPTAGFYAGTGSSADLGSFTKTYINTATANTTPSGSSTVKSGGYPTGQTAPSFSSWPNGYSAFYCMKYELSQGQYTDFLNCLNRTQQGHMVNSTISGSSVSHNYVMSNQNWALNRNYIACPTSGNGTTAAITFTCASPEIACNFMSYTHLASYLDWSGLRVMTELEFEKACRGDQTPVAGEYAWGSTSIYGSSYTLTNSGTSSEYVSSPSTSSGNVIYLATGGSYIDGVVRCGMFATSSTTRVTSGATYYGIMEMSGNLWERCVSISISTGRAYTGTHGDGEITSGGYATNSDWPGYVSSVGYVGNGTGSGYRGGSIAYGTARLKVSDRVWINNTDYGSDWGRGGRGVRTAP